MHDIQHELRVMRCIWTVEAVTLSVGCDLRREHRGLPANDDPTFSSN